jgi:hypothetical protein
MLFPEYESWELFKSSFQIKENEGKYSLMSHMSKDIDKWSTERLLKFLHMVHGLWPQIRNRPMLSRGVKRAFQKKFYKEIYGNDPLPHIEINDEKVKQELHLGTAGYEVTMNVESDGGIKIVKKTFKDDFAKKIGTLDLNGIITWAKEVGVSEDKINKHKDKPLGLAKMNLGNLIRKRVV